MNHSYFTHKKIWAQGEHGLVIKPAYQFQKHVPPARSLSSLSLCFLMCKMGMLESTL